MTRKTVTCCCFFIAFSLATPLLAQSDLGAITGTVKDATSAALPGVEVQVTDLGTGREETTTTGSTGLYRVNSLPIGVYTIQYSKNGFGTLSRSAVSLLIGQIAEIDVMMRVGSPNETVEVTSTTPLLQTRIHLSRLTSTTKQSANCL